MTSTELRQAEAAIAALTVTIERARTRRNEIDAHGTQLAPRLTMRRSLATGGELVDWVFRRPRLAPRPITLLIDVSGSMELHARLMLRFAHVLRRIDRRTEVFVFGTRLTRVTRSARLARRGPRPRKRCHGGPRLVRRHAHRRVACTTFNRRWARPHRFVRWHHHCLVATAGTAATRRSTPPRKPIDCGATADA